MKPFRFDKLAMAEADDARFDAEVAALDADWQRLDSRGDFRAEVEREKLRPRLSAALAEQVARRKVTAALREMEMRANHLLPLRAALYARVQAQVASIKATVTVPDRETLVALHAAGRDLEALRAVLFDITQDPALRERYDPIEDLRWFWHQQHEQRQKCFSHHLSRPHLPARTTPEWAEDVARLKTLREATSAA
jgi:hypothetical protein